MIYLFLSILLIIAGALYVNHKERKRTLTKKDLIEMSKKGFFK